MSQARQVFPTLELHLVSEAATELGKRARLEEEFAHGVERSRLDFLPLAAASVGAGPTILALKHTSVSRDDKV